MTALQQGLAPVAGPHTRLLVLGSFPGVASLQAQQYYGHPRNQFWPLMAEVVGQPLPEMDYAARLECLQAHHIGLWDVITHALRQGSLDSNIRSHVGSDLRGLLATLPELRALAFNGATAARIGLQQLGAAAQRYQVFKLPSSSPAYTLAYAQKRQAWLQLKTLLGN
jgi:hypoxanthine-DNA glycosylase